MILIALPRTLEHEASAHIRQMARRYPGHVYLGAAPDMTVRIRTISMPVKPLPIVPPPPWSRLAIS